MVRREEDNIIHFVTSIDLGQQQYQIQLGGNCPVDDTKQKHKILECSQCSPIVKLWKVWNLSVFYPEILKVIGVFVKMAGVRDQMLLMANVQAIE